MKLFRSDLEQRISSQFFEIAAESLDLGELQLAESHLRCVISVDTLSHGYRVHGTIEAMAHETCDRCLVRFKGNFQSLLNVILTDDQSLLNEKNVDVIQFTDTEEFIDLSSVIHDLVLLEEPIKRLCKKSCKGLCPACGKNLNKTTCTCTVSEHRSRWDALKNLNN